MGWTTEDEAAARREGLDLSKRRIDNALAKPAAGNIHVTPENVLDVGGAIFSALTELRTVLHRESRNLWMEPAGRDRVSAEVAEAWNDRITRDPDSIIRRVTQYLKNMETVSEQVKAAARQYGKTDDDIRRAFTAKPLPADLGEQLA